MPQASVADWDPITPVFENPYPQGWREGEEVCCLEQIDDLWLVRCRRKLRDDDAPWDREHEYVLAKDYRVRVLAGNEETVITAPRGMLTDLATARWYSKPFLGRVGPHLEAAVMHDFLSIAWQDLPGPDGGVSYGAHRRDWAFGNQLMVSMAREAGVHPIIAEGIDLVLSSELSWTRYADPNPGVRYVKVPD